jgi:transposase
VTRTYAPCGQTPILRAPKTREHLSVIGGVTAAGRLFTHSQADAFTGQTVVAFLRQLLRQIRGKLLVVWDGASIHHGQAVKAFLTQGAAARMHLERLPAYAPELNPAEGIWNMLKRGELKNRCCQELDEVRWELGLAIRRLQRRRDRVRGCVAPCGCR